jgi:hypothetical protein
MQRAISNCFFCVGENEEWVREKHPIAIHSIDKYPKRFHKFNLWAGQNLEKRGKEKVFPLLD